MLAQVDAISALLFADSEGVDHVARVAVSGSAVARTQHDVVVCSLEAVAAVRVRSLVSPFLSLVALHARGVEEVASHAPHRLALVVDGYHLVEA